MVQAKTHHLKGAVVGGCNCEWGCPCNFEMPPNDGFCEGEYVWCLERGRYDDVQLDGLNFGMFFHSPKAIHLGNLTTSVVADVRANAQQRAALEDMIAGVAPFKVFLDLTGTFLGFRYEPFEVHLDGIQSRITIPGIYDLELTPMTNPVTGEPELATLTKPTGFTSNIQELCATSVETFNVEGLSYDHSGRYGEFAPFEYKNG